MKAASFSEAGGPEVIQFCELPVPELSAGQVLIRVHAASVNPIDTYVRRGIVAFELPKPFVPGCDAAGVVEAVGEGVADWKVGDRVWCTNQGLLGRQGTTAELIAVDAQWCFRLPDQVDFETAAANALVGVTAHLGLFRYGGLKAGETVFVVGGTGGVGSMVVQMAKAVGATVITCAGSDEKVQRASDLGADHVFNYNNQSIGEAVKQFAPNGIQLHWETRRMPNFDEAIDLLAPRGRMVVMAGRDSRPEFPVGPFYVKECSLVGFVMFKASPEEMKVCADEMNEWMAAGKLKANIAARFSMEQMSDAHQLQECDGVGGKIVITR
ncbi:NADPH:quinone reductase [Rhodopirellula sp. MGV]|uniref:NADPH:quinone reductase n=1 Tax=Rhodopirellula sp. MGV TaxID=2023130 RepID=UPI000B9733B0|nr:NADPH:quinone reductase [Rhodopirellula sp. MGV]OYP34360.1 quinone oxidoreductase [Rhodopirellula sp. MGV]PNY35238.1 NADPH:quinone reductase [Rhodopirellula baltica]